MAAGEALATVEAQPTTEKVKGGEKPSSLVGLSLGRPDTSSRGHSAPSGTRPLKGNPDVSARIAQRYAAEVKEAELERLRLFIPLDQRSPPPLRPDGRDMARTVKGDLDKAIQKAGRETVPWDAVLGEDSFQKRMQFLCGHAKSGHFVEEYGVDGRYEGEFLYGMRHGQGKHNFRGEVYEGEWKWDQRHGSGTLKLPDGSTIHGAWQGGKPSGFVAITDAKGTVVYEGEFKDGKRHGLGRQVFESGDIYDGGWKCGRLHERGIYYFTNGDKLMGMWKEGLYDGVGVFHYADGSISRRVYKDGLLMSVQDYEHTSQRFGKTITRNVMQKHTQDRDFPKDVFLLSST